MAKSIKAESVSVARVEIWRQTERTWEPLRSFPTRAAAEQSALAWARSGYKTRVIDLAPKAEEDRKPGADEIIADLIAACDDALLTIHGEGLASTLKYVAKNLRDVIAKAKSFRD